MNRGKAHTSSDDTFRAPLHVTLFISISAIFAIDDRGSMLAYIQPNSI